MRALAALALAMAIAAVAAGCGGSSSSKGPANVTWYVFKEPGGAFDAAAAKCSKDSNGKYQVKVVALPTDSDQQRELIALRRELGEGFELLTSEPGVLAYRRGEYVVTIDLLAHTGAITHGRRGVVLST